MITGKGYPCLSTRYLVAQCVEQLELPVYILVDCDPHGIAVRRGLEGRHVSASW